MTDHDDIDEALFSVTGDEPLPPPPRPAPIEDDAPYGYKEDGTPYKRRPYTRKAGGKAAPKGRATNTSQTVSEAVTSVYGVIVALLVTLARAMKSTPLMADGIVTAKAGPKVIPPLTKLVERNERLVEMCQKLVGITPGVEVAQAIVPLLAEILTIHGMVPGGEGRAEAIVKAYEKEVQESGDANAGG